MIANYGLGLKLFPRGGNEVEINAYGVVIIYYYYYYYGNYGNYY
jgi:hypothetical protein